MANSFPYFRWWVKDAVTDEMYSSLTDAELGFYHRCLNLAWTNGGLPADPAARAKALGKSRAYADKMWKVIGSKFAASSDLNRLVNNKQEEERKYVREMSERNASAVRSRYERRSNEHQRASGSDSVSGSESVVPDPEAQKKKLEVPLPRGYAMDEQYEDFRNACKSWGMNVVDPEDFIAAWPEWRVLDGFQRAAAVAGIYDLRNAGADPAFAKSPRNYLRSREWKRPIKSAKSSGLSAEEIAAL